MGNTLNKKEDSAIDIAKFVCSILIISIHTKPFKDYSEVFNCYLENVFSRLAICLFFVISGFYFFKGLDFEKGKIKKSKENRNKLLKYVSRVFILYVVWSFIYLLWMIPGWYQTGWLSIKAFIDFGISFLFIQSYYHLWFLLSLVYAIPIMYLVLRFVKLKYFVVASFIIYVFGVLSDSYSFIGLPTNSISQTIAGVCPRLRTVIFCVIPLLTISLIADKINLSAKKKVSFALLFFADYSLEAMMLYNFTDNKDNFIYIFLTLPTVLFIFVAIRIINIEIKSGYLLRKISTIIYCIHPLVMNVVNIFEIKNEINSILYFVVVAVVSILISLLIFTAYKKIKPCGFLRYIM